MPNTAKLTVRIPDNLQGEIEDRLWEAFSAWSEIALMHMKDNAPVRYASADAPYGWPLSYMAYSGKPEGRRRDAKGRYLSKPKGEVQGGTLRRGTYAKPDRARLRVKYGAKVPYLLYVHEGTSRMKGRPYITEGIKRNLDRLHDLLAQKLEPDFI